MISQTPIAAPIRELLALFEQDLSEVVFPQVDRQVLSGLSDQVSAAFHHLNECQAQVEAARAELDERRAQLLKLAQTAQDYARIYASDDPGLSAKIDAIELKPALTRKTRKSKAKATPKPKDHTIPLALADKAKGQEPQDEAAA